MKGTRFFVLLLLLLIGCTPIKRPSAPPVVPPTADQPVTFQSSFFPAPNPVKALTLPTEEGECLKVGQEFLTTIVVQGDSGDIGIPIPMDVVFLLDQSGSMERSDNSAIRLTAIDHFIASLADPGRGSRDYAAIIEYANRAHGLYPYTPVGVPPMLSNNYSALRAALTASADGCTNIEEAMRLANDSLSFYSNNAKKLAILLTDGCPSKIGPSQCVEDYGQIENISSEVVPTAVERGIRYYTVGLGQEEIICRFLLENLIATPSGGKFCHAESASDLPACFADIFETESNLMTTQDVVVEEILAQGFRYKPGTLTISSGSSVDSDAEGQFTEEGRINVSMGQILDGNEESFTFVTSCEECVEPVMPNETVSEDELVQTRSVDAMGEPPNQARVKYQLGEGVIRYMSLPDETVCVERPGGPTIQKHFDPVTNEVTLRIKSNYLTSHPEHVIRDIHVWDILAERWEAQQGSFSIPPDEIWGTTSKAPYGFYYHWSVGNLAPQQEWSVTFKVRCAACMLLDTNPLGIDYYKDPSYMEMILPESTKAVKFEIPQAYTPADYPLPLCTTPARPVDFGIEPARMLGEPPEFVEETGAIWLDNSNNGYVDDWSNATQVQNSIQHTQTIEAGTVIPLFSGDPLALNVNNRIYVGYRYRHGIPTGETLVLVEARPGFQSINKEHTEWIPVAYTRLTPDQAIITKPNIGFMSHYVVLNWTPSIEHLRRAIKPGHPTITPLTLNNVTLRATIRTPQEVLKNNNQTTELIKEIE